MCVVPEIQWSCFLFSAVIFLCSKILLRRINDYEDHDVCAGAVLIQSKQATSSQSAMH